MFFARLLIIVHIFIASPVLAAENFLSAAYCDYYDLQSNLLISFSAKSQLMQDSQNSLGGITMLLPDGTHLRISPIRGDEDDTWDAVSYPRALWLDRYMKVDCKLVDMSNTKGRRISCPHSEHTLLYTSVGAKGAQGIFIDIKHEFEGNSPSQYYNSIVDSLQLLHGAEAANAARVVAAMGSPDFDPANPLTQPRIFCGKDRIRAAILPSTAPSPK